MRPEEVGVLGEGVWQGAANPLPPARSFGGAVSSPSGIRAQPQPLNCFVAF